MDTRPTSDRLRETLFNVLSALRPDALVDSVWLDVFAGTGAVGIEALSRGARMAYFIEWSRRAAGVVRENLGSLGITEGFELIERDSSQALRLLDSEAVVCDFCFLDPPYSMEDAYEQALGFLSQSRLLQASSIVIAEHVKRFDPGDRFGTLQRFRTLKQGDTVLSFYRME